MMKLLTAAVLLLAGASTAFAQARPEQTTPNIAPSQAPAVTPSQTPSVTPSTGAPVVGSTAPAPVIQERQIGGLSRCQNLLAFERDKCLQDEQSAATGGTRTPTPATGTTTPTPQSPAAPSAGATAPQTPAPAAPGATTPQAPAPAGQTPAPVGQTPAPAGQTPAPAGTRY